MSGYTPGPVVFNYTTWTTQYPEFSNTSEAQAQVYFNIATLYLDNTTCSLVVDNSVGGQREALLYMLTSHITQMLLGNNTSQSNQLVGRISNATEGSVSVAADMPTNPNAAWFMQTKYGAMFWQATAQFRTARYINSRQRYLGTGLFPGSVFGGFGP